MGRGESYMGEERDEETGAAHGQEIGRVARSGRGRERPGVSKNFGEMN